MIQAWDMLIWQARMDDWVKQVHEYADSLQAIPESMKHEIEQYTKRVKEYNEMAMAEWKIEEIRAKELKITVEQYKEYLEIFKSHNGVKEMLEGKTYEYKCPDCGFQLFSKAPLSGTPPFKCPRCLLHNPEMGRVLGVTPQPPITPAVNVGTPGHIDHGKHKPPCCFECGKPLTGEEIKYYETFCHTHANDYVGEEQHQPGAKLDTGKNRLGLVLGGFSKALWQVGKVGTVGAKKYSDNGWMEVPEGINRYTDAMMRHYLSYASGELIDLESQQPHLVHCCWNVLAMLELTLREQEEKISNEKESM